MSVALHAKNGYALPPVNISGKVSSAYRLTKPAEGADTGSWTNTLEVQGSSYIWEPWFGVWQARGAVSRADTSSDRDTTADFLTGEVQVNLFHRSRFPFTAFVGVQDSRIEITDLSQGANDIRTWRLGVTQQFQDLDKGIFYFGSLRRDEQQDLTSGENAVLDRLTASVNKTGVVHNFTGELSVTQNKVSIANSEVETAQTSFVHSYRPSSNLTVSTHANAITLDASSDLASASTDAVALGTQAEWRPDDGKLRLRGNFDVGREESSASDAEEDFRNTLKARVSARYELSDEASIFSEVGVETDETEADAVTNTFQRISGTYTSKPIDWNRYAYTWTAGAGFGNATSSEEGNTRSGSALLGHAITRTWLPDLGGPVPVVFSAGQDGEVLEETDEEAEMRLTHRATVSATRATEAGSSYAQLSAFDIRNFGRTEAGLFTVTLLGSHSGRITRYRSVDFTAAYSYNMSSNEDDTRQTDNLSLELRYRDSRLYDINRLEFESRLRSTMTDLFAATERDLLIDLEWDNRLRYRIGLLEVETRAAMTQTDSRRNWIFLISLTRRF